MVSLLAIDICYMCGDYSCPGPSYHSSKQANWVLKEPAAIAPVILMTDEVNNEMESAMDKAITPYRSADLTRPAPTGPKHGFIWEPKKHRCRKPGTFRMLYHWLRGKETVGSLWRCRKCGNVFIYDSAYGDHKWQLRTSGIWTANGGVK